MRCWGSNAATRLFAQHGLACWGIDISKQQIEQAEPFCTRHRLNISFAVADMRTIPHDSGSFDYVYERYSMCHLSKEGTARAIGEMFRVLKPGGMAFLGVISDATRPRGLLGEERAPGEFWTRERGDAETRHSVFADDEANHLVEAWENETCVTRSSALHRAVKDLSLDEWMTWREDEPGSPTEASWKSAYAVRERWARYAHRYYILRKPAIST